MNKFKIVLLLVGILLMGGCHAVPQNDIPVLNFCAIASWVMLAFNH